ncbi:tyrosine-type recombinase/integrase [Ruminococcus difficilis]|nr:tyrosine-type recombinase/integrase [Ruminococcus difficilis]
MEPFENNNQMIDDYICFCHNRKNLNSKTIKSYRIDLRQYKNYIEKNDMEWRGKQAIESYIEELHDHYKPKSVKRKIASLKAFFHYLELEDIIENNPFHKIQIKYKEPFILPKTIPLNSIKAIICYAYEQIKLATTVYSQKIALRNALILELLFVTGMRISELCSLNLDQIDRNDYIIRINGKGSKERLIQICNSKVQQLLDLYIDKTQNDNNRFFFVNRRNNPLSEQSVRYMISNYAKKARITQHITPHMFRHSFATLLLEEGVDIRYIQQMLGHSSITTTQIYTHTSISKQKIILATKHPRNKMEIQ